MTRFLTGAAGILIILLIAFAFSSNRHAIRLRVVGAAFALQAGIAVLVLYVPAGRTVIGWLSAAISALLGYANAGTAFVFGALATSDLGRSFALQALPVIIFFAALVSILYYLRVMPLLIRWVGGAIERIVGISKVESLCVASNIFVGQSESPLVIRPYLPRLSEAQMFMVMTAGMAGVAGTILAAYASMGISIDHLLAASFMSAPGAILMAKIMMPDVPLAPERADLVEEAMIARAESDEAEERPSNVIMAAAAGAQTGVQIAMAVGAMVLAFVGLVALANGLLSHVGLLVGVADLSFQKILGWLFAPVMVLLNIPWSEAGVAGGMFGEKIVLNEFFAFIHLGKVQASLSPRTVGVITFALCGFANFSSIAIQMAAAGSLAPNQRPTIAKLGIKALIAGSLANLMSAALAGMLLPG